MSKINLFVLGDQGFTSNVLERHVADAMDLYRRGQQHGGDGTLVDLDAVLLLGDNFEEDTFAAGYDPQFLNVFQAFDVPFYVTLGNHDLPPLQSLANAQEEWTQGRPPHVPPTGPRWTVGLDWPNRHYRVDLPTAEAPLVTLLELDSNGHTQVASGDAFLAAELEKIAQAGQGQWVIVFTHYPLYTNGCHKEGAEFPNRWKPRLQNHVHFYLSGHNHNLEHLEVSDPPGHPLTTSFLLSGAGGQVYKLRSHHRGPFARSLAGFFHLRLLPDRAEVKVIGFRKNDPATSAQVVHSFVRDFATGSVTLNTPAGPDGVVPLPLDPSEIGTPAQMHAQCGE